MIFTKGGDDIYNEGIITIFLTISTTRSGLMPQHFSIVAINIDGTVILSD